MLPTDDRITPTSLSQSGIYQIRNLVNGKVYIGSAVDIKSRWRVHRHHLARGVHHSQKLQRAWNKYGPDSFVFEVCEFIADVSSLTRVEQEYLDKLRPFDSRVGYNISPTAGSPLGVKHTSEMKARVSAAQVGRKMSAETRAAMSRARTGRKHSPETKALISAAHRGRKLTPEHRVKLSIIHSGKTLTPEHRANISAALKGRVFSPETLAKMAESKKHISPETRAKMSEAAKKREAAKREVNGP